MGRTKFDFEGETVIVTGGSSGIGRAIALEFGRAGATVLNADIRATSKDVDAQTPTHEAIEADGGTAEFVETDVSDPDALAAVVERAEEIGVDGQNSTARRTSSPGVDVMVNNAGVFVREEMLDVSIDDFEFIHDINSKGVFCGCQVAGQAMKDRGEGGVIINTASISSTHAQKNQVPYDSTKGAIRMITRGAALEFAEHDVRVNAVAPGHIATEFGAGAEKKEQAVVADDLVKPIPLDRPGYPEDVAPAVLFLASDQAGYVTGETMYVDGGWQVF
ncbi:SDR family NAD(P)-dependent oxidoreductase [Halalkalicoccus sp. NIPERK01]|uniref:SDR family NAD(P)-dependent oxidoreductase n=1 Tax=Halalkalicoccus sp. NIPERK01 TaxID=3053469 RepID=UPI00256F5D80|nr:SDR family oxidoreductase [Halalkalicoccus sp. NIPERK01]MDL5363251.1 SDR family oxidoreductase [Halalkalicoccus sp. NIPERK01]